MKFLKSEQQKPNENTKIYYTFEKDDFYSHLNIEYITNADYTYIKRTCKDFKIKNVGNYHNLDV